MMMWAEVGDELEEARIAELQKMMDFGAVKAVWKDEARGKNTWLSKRADQRTERIMKSSFTDADVKGKNRMWAVVGRQERIGVASPNRVCLDCMSGSLNSWRCLQVCALHAPCMCA